MSHRDYDYDCLGEEHTVHVVAPQCPHPQEALITKVIGGVINCETTVTVCTICGQRITEPVTDC